MIRSVICYFVFVLLHITVQVKSQVCRGIPQYDRCSTNGACGCLHMIGASDIGICGFLYTSCSELVSCQSPNNICYESDHICVHHPRCHLHPVCYPASMIDQQICPSMAMTNTTTTTTTATTTTIATTTQQWVPPPRAPPINIDPNAKWVQNGLTVAGGNGRGNNTSQFNNPLGLYVDDDQTVYVADRDNHRIIEWKYGATSGRVVAGGNGPGNRTNQLNTPLDVIVDKERDSLIISDSKNRRVIRWPRRNGMSGETIISDISCTGLTLDENGSVYVSDERKHEVRRYRIGDTKGTVVAGGNEQGTRLDQLSFPDYVFVDRDHSVYVSNSGDNPRVMKWEEGAKQGIVVAGGKGQGSSLTQLYFPTGIVVDRLGTMYLADYWNHRIMRWPKGATQGSVIVGGNGQGGQSNQFFGPKGLSFDRHGNLYVVDYHNLRVQKFSIEKTTN